METPIKINNKEVSEQEFKKIKEETQNDKSKLLKEVQPGQFKVLNKMNG
jgi:hypothetical protein